MADKITAEELDRQYHEALTGGSMPDLALSSLGHVRMIARREAVCDKVRHFLEQTAECPEHSLVVLTRQGIALYGDDPVSTIGQE